MLSTKQYIDKYFNGSSKLGTRQSEFIDELKKEFLERLETEKAFRANMGADFEYTHFQHIVSDMKRKIQAIDNKIPGGTLPKNVMDTLFIITILPIRATLFPNRDFMDEGVF